MPSEGFSELTRPGFFLTGTDTGVGKTVVSAALMSSAPSNIGGLGPLGYWKPVQTGDDDDAGTVRKLAPTAHGAILSPTYHFQLPASPHHAAEVEDGAIELETLQSAWAQLSPQMTPFMVEGAGGWMVPLSRDALWADIVTRLEIPVLLAASTRLGCINHTLLSIAAIERTCRIVGVIMVGPYDPSAWSGIKSHSDVPILGHLGHGTSVDSSQIKRWGDALWAGPTGTALSAALTHQTLDSAN